MVELKRFWRPSSNSDSGATNRGDEVATIGRQSSSAGIENLHINAIGVSEVYCDENPQVEYVRPPPQTQPDVKLTRMC